MLIQVDAGAAGAFKYTTRVMLTNLGNAYGHVKRYDDAAKTYRHALVLDPDNAPAHASLGWVLMQRGKPGDAISEYRKAIELDPTMPQLQKVLDDALRMKDMRR